LLSLYNSYSQVARQVHPAPTDIVFSLAGFYILRASILRTSCGYQEDIFEQFEISKLASKMAAGVNRKITFELVDLESQIIPILKLNLWTIRFVLFLQS